MSAIAGDTQISSFEAFFRRVSQSSLHDLELLRRKTRITVVLGTVGPLLVAGLVLYGLFLLSDSIQEELFGVPIKPVLITVILGLGLCLPCIICSRKLVAYRTSFKRQLMPSMVEALDRGLKYDSADSVAGEVAIAELFTERSVNSSSGEDLIHGTVGSTAIRFSEIRLQNVSVVNRKWFFHKERSLGRPEQTRYREIFKGMFFIAEVDTPFSGKTYILPDRAQRWLGRIGQSLQGLNTTYGELVRFDNTAFEKFFAVFSANPGEARTLVSGELMQRLAEFSERTTHRPRIAFVGSRVYVAFESTKDHFEPRLFRSLVNPRDFREVWDDLRLVLGLIDTLKLNTLRENKGQSADSVP